MPIVENDYTWVFDSVEFGIALRSWMERTGIEQEEVAVYLQLESASVVSMLANARYDDMLKMRHFLTLCHMMDLSPSLFFSIQLVGV